MANKNLFSSPRVQPTNTVNRAGGAAYQTTAEHTLCQYAVTCMFGSTYYASAKEQLDEIKKVLPQCRPEIIAKAAVYSRNAGRLKDMPALLLVYLLSNGYNDLADAIFPKVVNNSKMLLNVVQMLRSGVFGKRAVASNRLKKMIARWFYAKNGKQLFLGNIGHKPSLGDVIRLAHVKPRNPQEVALYTYLMEKPLDTTYRGRSSGKSSDLPEYIKAYERFKKSATGNVPDVPFTCLTNFALTTEQWKQKTMQLPWNTLRMNLNNLGNKGVFGDSQVVDHVAATLSNPDLVHKFNAMPYELMQTLRNAVVPMQINIALQHALAHSLDNVPAFKGHTVVAIDTSGSMSWGNVNGISCLDTAALFASAILRKNPSSTLIWFDTRAGVLNLNPLDSITTNANKLKQFGGGGTNCSLPMNLLNSNSIKADTIIYLSDNESWAGIQGGMAFEWETYRRRNANAKLVLVDLTPNRTTQVQDGRRVLNVGGFNDSVFDVIGSFIESNGDSHFVDVVNQVSLEV